MLLTCGHGTASADELAALIRGANIAHVVDVRTAPKSRRFPHVWEAAMSHWVLDLAGAAYSRAPALGGFRRPAHDSHNVALRHPSFRAYADYMGTPTFLEALDTLLATAGRERTAIMCSETLWWRCYRRLIAAAAMILRNVDVQHLMHDGAPKPHVPTQGVRLTQERSLRYDIVQ